MKFEGEQNLLRVHLRNTDKCGWQSAADVLVQRARSEGLAGGTLLRGVYGLDLNGQVLDGSVWSLVKHVPVIVEFVDEPRKIGIFLKTLGDVLPEGIVTLERAHVLRYRHENPTSPVEQQRLAVPARIADLSTLPDPQEFPIMQLSEDGQLLRVFIGDSDMWEGQLLYRTIVLKARDLGMAGATVLHGSMGFGANSRVHAASLLELSTDLPVLIEIVDTADRISSLLPFLDEAVQEGMITIEAVRVLRYRHGCPEAGKNGP